MLVFFFNVIMKINVEFDTINHEDERIIPMSAYHAPKLSRVKTFHWKENLSPPTKVSEYKEKIEGNLRLSNPEILPKLLEAANLLKAEILKQASADT